MVEVTFFSLTAEKYAHSDPETDGFCIQLTIFGLVLFIGIAA